MHRPKAYALSQQGDKAVERSRPADEATAPVKRKSRTLTPAAYKKAATLEKHVQQAVTQFLELDGWRAIRTEHAIERNERGDFKRKVGEKAMPDYLYIQYSEDVSERQRLFFNMTEAQIRAEVDVLWIEFKRPGEQPRTEQVHWIEAERRRGALVMVVDDIDWFIAWYKTSGLQRR